MVITKLYGGLGNQMFQYAAGLSLSSRLKTNLYINVGWFEGFEGNQNVTQRTYELGAFGIMPQKMSLVDKVSVRFYPLTVFREDGLQYHPEFERLKGNIFLDGYWQSYKYINDSRDAIVKAFAFPDSISDENKKLLKQINQGTSVSLHIRRGDYASHKSTKAYHGLLDSEYYHKAVSLIVKKFKETHLLIFSDDPEWCRENLSFKVPTTFVGQNGVNSGVEDMRLMAACNHNIIANSSFSWWAAWLNHHPNKLIYAPRKWFQKDLSPIEDRLPPEWIKI